jgi:hypothetical protein
MEEPEVPIDDVHEEIHHHAEHARERWISAVALSTALLAALAAICSLFSGDNVNEAMIEQIRTADQWSYYQAKGIKATELSTRIELLDAIGKPIKEADRNKLAEYRQQQEQAKHEAEEMQQAAERRLHKHRILAGGVTMFQIAIAISAISVLTRQRWFWAVGLLFGGVGVAFMAYGLAVR